MSNITKKELLSWVDEDDRSYPMTIILVFSFLVDTITKCYIFIEEIKTIAENRDEKLKEIL